MARIGAETPPVSIIIPNSISFIIPHPIITPVPFLAPVSIACGVLNLGVDLPGSGPLVCFLY